MAFIYFPVTFTPCVKRVCIWLIVISTQPIFWTFSIYLLNANVDFQGPFHRGTHSYNELVSTVMLIGAS